MLRKNGLWAPLSECTFRNRYSMQDKTNGAWFKFFSHLQRNTVSDTKESVCNNAVCTFIMLTVLVGKMVSCKHRTLVTVKTVTSTS